MINTTCTISAGGCSFPLFRLLQTGTHTVTFSPVTSTQTLSATAQLVTDTTAILSADSPYNLALTAGQDAALTFTASAGQTFVLNIGSVSTTPTAINYHLQVFDSAGNTPSGGSGTVSTSSPLLTLNLANLAANTYTLLIWPDVASSASMQVTLGSGVTGALPVDGASSTFVTGQPGQTEYLRFSGTAGQNLSLLLTNASLVPSGTTVYRVQVNRPDGGFVINSSCTLNANGCSFSMFRLLQTGTYAVTLSPVDSTQKLSVTARVITSVNATISPDSPYNLTLAAGQDAAVNFTTTGGQYFALNIGSVTSTPAAINYHVQVVDPAGNGVSGGSATVSTSSPLVTMNLTNLPANTYTVMIWPDVVSSAGMQIALGSGVTGVLPVDGAAATFQTAQPGQTEYLSFSGVAGQNLSLLLTNASLVPSGTTVYRVQVNRPDGGFVINSSCTLSANGCSFSMFRLLQTGTYTVTLSPVDSTQKLGVTAQIITSVNATLSPDLPYNLTLAPGQDAALTFTANGGQYFALNVASVTTTPAAINYHVQIVDSAGNGVSGGSVSVSTSSPLVTMNLTNLPANTYTVMIWPDIVSTAGMRLTLGSGVTGALPVDGPASTFVTNQPGQTEYLSFSGTAGQNLSLLLTNASLVPGGTTVYRVQVNRPDGGFVVNSSCTLSANGCSFSMFRLLQTGTYTVTLSPVDSTQKLSVTAQIITSVNAALSPDSPYGLVLNGGQDAALTFTASAGQYFALNIGSVTSTPAAINYHVQVVDPAGNGVSGGSVTVSTSSSLVTMNLTNLPANTYTVMIWPDVVSSASMQITLGSGVTGVLPVDGAATNFATGQPGQTEYLRFSGTAGQNLSLLLTNASLVPGGTTVYRVQVNRPDGGFVVNSSCTLSANGCSFSMFRLLQTGTYTVTLSPVDSTQKLSVTAQIITSVNAALSPDSPYGLALNGGQDAALTFTASAGQYFALNIGSVTSTPAAINYHVQVVDPAGNGVSGGSVTVSTSSPLVTMNLTNLPANTYTVMIWPDVVSSASMQVTLGSGVTGVLPVDGAAATYTTGQPGQTEYLSFAGTAGQNLALVLTNAALIPSGTTSYRVQVTRPDGGSIVNTSCTLSANGCSFPMFRLASAGTYAVMLFPSDSTQKLGVTVQVVTDVSGSLTANTPFGLNLTVPGQNAALSFTATAGQTIALTSSSIVSSPASTSYLMQVYNAAGSVISSTSTATGATLNLTSLAAGTYTVLVSLGIAATTAMQINYH